jgi:hypothetical protein
MTHVLELLAGVLAVMTPVPAQESPELWERVETLFDAGEEYRVVELMADAPDPSEVAANYSSVVRSLYYSGKNLPAVVFVAGKGIDFGLSHAVAAERRGDTETARRFRGRVKELAYNLASFTWPGWDEPGIDIRTSDLAAGFAAARLNLRLAEELDRGPEPMANAYFILGAHSLAAPDYDAAAAHFLRFGEIAREAGLEELALLADGYGLITDAASRSGNPGGYVLEPIRERFREVLDDGAGFWIDQLDTAWNVFVTG